ncbi:MAG: DNA-protecting protein DprA [Synergistaceae bacterium]|nr:DNA-protecting protein DprA [Synergistaceae bacterium]
MDESLKTLLLLNSLEGQGRKLWFAIKRGQLSQEELWKCNTKLFTELGITERTILAIKTKTDNRWSEVEMEKCLKLDIRAIGIEDKDYPAKLKDLKDPPLLLYWHGSEKKVPHKCIGVVGTRRASTYGRRMAQRIGEYCSSAGIALISGGASGIDGNAHQGACISGGKTFAVFGTGPDIYFPQSNANLFRDISECGALISELPIGTQGEPWHFPRRNRIVAALSSKLIVVEAPLKSGAMITAGFAAELGREVWAVPGRIDEGSAYGSNKLIFDGAYPLIDLKDFFETNTSTSAIFSNNDPKSDPVPDLYLSPEEEEILKVLRRSGGQTVDNIALEVKMSAADILKTIAILSAKGIICSSGSGRYGVNV